MGVKAYVLCATDPSETSEVYRTLTSIEGVVSCHHTTGSWDVVCLVEGETPQDISRLVRNKIRAVQGVRNTETLFAFDEP